MLQRGSGLLLHPTSLPGPFGIGDLGPGADAFLDWCRSAGQSWWQMLPLGPPEAHGSPYSSLSAFAGNPLLLSPERLVEDGLLEPGDLPTEPLGCPERVDFGVVGPAKEALFRRAWGRARPQLRGQLGAQLEEFRRHPDQQSWLEDWCLFSALRGAHDQQPWWRWDRALARREPAALKRAAAELSAERGYHRFLQFLFHRQWQRLSFAARERGVRLFGDIPIYVAGGSAEVWARPELFELDEDFRPLGRAGVPPDPFTAHGQLWGNPLYRWDRLAAEGYRWWVERVAAARRQFELLRLDHFRGFEAYWRVPAGAETAEHGEWVPGPGIGLFRALKAELGELPLVAEDLGVITPPVEALRRELGLPGMAILQFAFGEGGSLHAPHGIGLDRVMYTGTHDNETAAGWFESLDEGTRRRVLDYSGAADPEAVPWALIRLAQTSVAVLAMVPVQDLLALGNEARMNVPGVAAGNWQWRLPLGKLTEGLAARLLNLTEIADRRPAPTER